VPHKKHLLVCNYNQVHIQNFPLAGRWADPEAIHNLCVTLQIVIKITFQV
jgi:hypothetical protein